MRKFQRAEYDDKKLQFGQSQGQLMNSPKKIDYSSSRTAY